MHEKEERREEVTDEFGSVTFLPDVFESLVSQSVQLIKEALLSEGDKEDDILSYQVMIGKIGFYGSRTEQEVRRAQINWMAEKRNSLLSL